MQWGSVRRLLDIGAALTSSMNTGETPTSQPRSSSTRAAAGVATLCWVELKKMWQSPIGSGDAIPHECLNE